MKFETDTREVTIDLSIVKGAVITEREDGYQVIIQTSKGNYSKKFTTLMAADMAVLFVRGIGFEIEYNFLDDEFEEDFSGVTEVDGRSAVSKEEILKGPIDEEDEDD